MVAASTLKIFLSWTFASQLSVPFQRGACIQGKHIHELIQALPQLPDCHSRARSLRQADPRLQGQPLQITTLTLLLMHPLYRCTPMDRTF